jgi:hypothetical protein
LATLLLRRSRHLLTRIVQQDLTLAQLPILFLPLVTGDGIPVPPQPRLKPRTARIHPVTLKVHVNLAMRTTDCRPACKIRTESPSEKLVLVLGVYGHTARICRFDCLGIIVLEAFSYPISNLHEVTGLVLGSTFTVRPVTLSGFAYRHSFL